MKESELNQEIFSRYGAVTRARGPFLYTKKGVRLTDCFQAGGRAILGWGGGDAFTRFKNILNRGLTGTFITEYTSQIDRAVTELLAAPAANENPSLNVGERSRIGKTCYKVYFFRDKKEALKAGLEIAPENTSVWMPWRDDPKLSEQKGGAVENKCVIITPPLPWGEAIYILAVARPDGKTNQSAGGGLSDGNDIQPRGDNFANPARPDGCVILPSPLVAAITRAVYDLIAALQSRTEKDFFLYDTILAKYFTRKGPYLYPKIAETKYDDFVRFCLDAEIVISPEYNTPSIIPFGADKGVFTKLKNATPPNSMFNQCSMGNSNLEFSNDAD